MHDDRVHGVPVDGPQQPGCHLLIPIKSLRSAKSRLRGAADGGAGDQRAHARLVAALAWDTVTAALHAGGVHGVTVITTDPDLTARFAAAGIEVIAEPAHTGLNGALRHGDTVTRGRHPGSRIGVLQADLPALRSCELEQALHAAGSARAFHPDSEGSGTTLLLAGHGQPLAPRFGPGSARAHLGSGAVSLAGCGAGPWPTLGRDVDTDSDLRAAIQLGVGQHTSAAVTGPWNGRAK